MNDIFRSGKEITTFISLIWGSFLPLLAATTGLPVLVEVLEQVQLSGKVIQSLSHQ